LKKKSEWVKVQNKVERLGFGACLAAAEEGGQQPEQQKKQR
jgi:hypothetical protein